MASKKASSAGNQQERSREIDIDWKRVLIAIIIFYGGGKIGFVIVERIANSFPTDPSVKNWIIIAIVAIFLLIVIIYRRKLIFKQK